MKYFVYVVCGEHFYIEQLNYSLKFLKHFTSNPILVVTDTSRNQKQIEHDSDKIINIKTPEFLNNNQASIYLETELGDILPFNNNQTYCYIDSDFIAINKSINEVFKYVTDYPIFAQDHCSIEYHSPHAINCDCLKKSQEISDEIRKIMDYFPKLGNNEICRNSSIELSLEFTKMKTAVISQSIKTLKYLWNRYFSSKLLFYLSNKFCFNKEERIWYDKNGNRIDFDKKYYINKLKKEKGYYQKGDIWKTKAGKSLIPEKAKCQHLQDFLKNEYQLNIDNNFKHWNGGAFVFDKRSVTALQSWHEITIDLMRNKLLVTKYIDQISLIITAFKHNFQNKAKLPVKYNFICDYGNKNLEFDKNLQFTCNNFKQSFSPAFLHIYHHWKDENWEIWQVINNIMPSNSEIINDVIFQQK